MNRRSLAGRSPQKLVSSDARIHERPSISDDCCALSKEAAKKH
jgi:hypothetical protein